MSDDEAVQPYAMPPAPDSMYGVQRRVSDVAGAAKASYQLLEGRQTQLLWRVCAYSDNALFRLSWGTYASHVLEGLRSPLAISIPGAFTLQAITVDRAQAIAAAGNLSVSSGGISIARTVQSVVGAISRYASRATAITAGVSVTINGNVVPVALGASVDLAWPATLVAGTVLLDHAL